ncbi:MAG: hypothetical protein HON51_05135 [Gammaproteobacteria bacterium]|jgi:hypothetical protein|nr:hypothetical protein [Gammaproteobacteria bacterium]MBT5825760.1 hypothetical protein [Gammaproteobacteria bacterium]MBT6419826.1 hypothetical protein [Gammaproteobacteria bacterium]MBT6575607.1 hypothetical protein [Gammaproteobacteria bacterium]MBT7435082.1 hypothetical protein [Gammaproteobacteria bacterium]
MAISINSEYMKKEHFKSENELQLCLENNPNLLMTETEPKIIFSRRQLRLTKLH